MSHYCSDHCLQSLLTPHTIGTPAVMSQLKNIYTCPMCPEIEQDEPDDRPKCSMTPEPKNLTADTDAAEDAEIRDMTRRFWIGTALTLPVVILAMAYLVPALARQSWVDSQISRWLQFALTTPVVLWAGWPFFRSLGLEFVMLKGNGNSETPDLSEAEIRIAMGTGKDVAMESAGITLVRGDVRGIVQAVRLSRATMRNIRQNLVFVFFYSALGIPVAAGVLYPFFGLLLSPIIAGAAMSLSSVTVISNALRLRKVRL